MTCISSSLSEVGKSGIVPVVISDKVFFNAEDGDESSFLSGASVKMGTEITVKANGVVEVDG